MTRMAYVALVWPRSTIQTKVQAQRRSLQRMEANGRLDHLVVTECTTDQNGDDWVFFGGTRVGRIRRGGFWRSMQNLFYSYPKLYRSLGRSIAAGGFDLVYIRKPPIFDGRSVGFMRSLKESGVRVILEIPTYPYDREFKLLSVQRLLDLRARRRVGASVNSIATLSDDVSIFGVPCVRIDNGADVDALNLGAGPAESPIHATLVAALEPWHRADRVVTAAVQAWRRGDNRLARLNIVGEGPERAALERAAAEFSGSGNRIVFHGPAFGERLQNIFAVTNLAIGSLETYSERGLTSARPLKHREYAARGIPFIYGLADPSFADSEYAYQVGNSKLDLEQVFSWYFNMPLTSSQIRADAFRFRWEEQFEKVLLQARKCELTEGFEDESH